MTLTLIEPARESDLTSLSLDELADVANREHQCVADAASELIRHTIAAGHALRLARQLVPPGEWLKWAAANLDVSLNMAHVYMRVSYFEDIVLASGATSLREAIRVLRKFGHTLDVGATSRYDEAIRHRAKDLAKKGLTQRQIGLELGVSQSMVGRWLNPRNAKRYRETQRSAVAALRREQQSQAAKRRGGNLAEAYSLARKLAEALDAASREETDPEARSALTSALHRLYGAEDQINQAIGTSKPRGEASLRISA